jgi:hypothetical protein
MKSYGVRENVPRLISQVIYVDRNFRISGVMSTLLFVRFDRKAITANPKAKKLQYRMTSIPYGDSSPPVRDQIRPYRNGLGRYPSKLLTTWLSALALYRRLSRTLEIIIPVILGIIPAPKNSRSHRSTINGMNDRMNGIGRATRTAQSPNSMHKFNAFFEVYPPILCPSAPPVRIPKVGAVIVTTT